MSSFDARVTPMRADLAATHLRGTVEAREFVDGEPYAVGVGRTALRTRPSQDSGMASELVFGEAVQVYERKDGWVWLQAARDGYVGYAQADVLGEPVVATHRVSAVLTPLLLSADVKSPMLDLLPTNAAVLAQEQHGQFVRIATQGYVFAGHLAQTNAAENDFVTVAERFLGAPYVWGGKTWFGLDCSGLVQSALQAANIACPRDSDMQEAALGHALPITPDHTGYRRGDLVFWKGHVGILRDAQTLLHANAHHMAVASEPLAEAVSRIEKSVGQIRAVKRLR